MFMALPSYIVTFCPKEGMGNFEWKVNTDEGLEAFCKVLRLNGVTAYSVKPTQAAIT
jgi:hypothetical protein